MKIAQRLEGIELSLIRQVNALATPLSLNLGIGEPNLVPDEAFREMARNAATASWAYTATLGNLSLRRAIAAPLGIDPTAEICIAAGTEEALYSIFQAWVEPGDEVLVPNPGFPAYPTLTRLAGGTAVTYDIEPPNWKLEAESVIRRITKKTKLIIVNTPSNPLGSTVSAEALDRIAEAADDQGCLVVADEVYSEIWYESPPASMFGRGRNTIIVSGLSKSHGMTGLRIGWVITRPEILKPITTAHGYVATCASAFSQTLAEMVLTSTEWNAQWLENVRAQFGAQRRIALDAIRRHLDADISAPGGAFYAFAPVPVCSSLPFARSLATDSAVVVIPGIAFDTNGEGFIRISYAASPETIATGIERVGRALAAAAR